VDICIALKKSMMIIHIDAIAPVFPDSLEVDQMVYKRIKVQENIPGSVIMQSLALFRDLRYGYKKKKTLLTNIVVCSQIRVFQEEEWPGLLCSLAAASSSFFFFCCVVRALLQQLMQHLGLASMGLQHLENLDTCRWQQQMMCLEAW
jgi:hypothetical protein